VAQFPCSSYDHFRNASTDSTRTSAESAQFAGLLKKLATVSYLSDLAIMNDYYYYYYYCYYKRFKVPTISLTEANTATHKMKGQFKQQDQEMKN
jgi:hypothetical protein